MLNLNGIAGTASVTLKALSALSKVVAEGYYAATTLDTVDADLAAGNIKTGVTVFGVTGTYDTDANPAAAADIALNKVAFVNGAKVTGIHV